MESPEHEKRAVTQYFEIEAPDEKVKLAEKVSSERSQGERHDVWNVHTNKTRWWVITNPTNLYSQDEFPSMDYALSFHIGLMSRLADKNRVDESEEEVGRLIGVWRRWEQASKALDKADEAEEFQAVGAMCRETLLSLVKEISKKEMLPPKKEIPKQGDFIGWSGIVADYLAKGEHSRHIRQYLKLTSQEVWELVGWLTHTKSATRYDGLFVLDATIDLISSFGKVLVRFESPVPERCPKCSSYRLTSDFRPELKGTDPYVRLCEACGWEETKKK